MLIGDGARATDPASGAALELPAGSASIGINNRLRRAIEAALAGAHCTRPMPALGWPPRACNRPTIPRGCP